MSGMLTTHGSLETSSHAIVYKVSAFGAVTALKDAFGYSRSLANCPMGAKVPSGFTKLVDTRRVISIVIKG